MWTEGHTHTHTAYTLTYMQPIQCSDTDKNTQTAVCIHITQQMAAQVPAGVSRYHKYLWWVLAGGKKGVGRCWQVSANILAGVSPKCALQLLAASLHPCTYTRNTPSTWVFSLSLSHSLSHSLTLSLTFPIRYHWVSALVVTQ